MSYAVKAKRVWTAEEYLVWEVLQEERHEYLRGAIWAMSGGSWVHNSIVANLNRRAGNVLEGKPCRALTSSQRVFVKQASGYFYPDVVIVCGAPRFGASDTLLNPLVVFEVLSPSTERFDRLEKREAYQSIESLREYVLVRQDEPMVEIYRRGVEGVWVLEELVGLESVLRLESVECVLPFSEIYEGVEFGDASDIE